MEIHVESPREAFYWGVQIALQAGKPSAPRGKPIREVWNYTCHIDYPHLIPFEIPGRALRPFIGAVEALQLVGQVAHPDLVIAGSKAMGNYTDDGIFHGAYGHRVYGQLQRVVHLLQSDPDSRQAVITIYDGSRDLGQPVRDIPCTLTIQFYIRQGELGMRVSMRSNDVWLGLPYDLTQFAALQCAVADSLDIPAGLYTHTVGSLHIYESDIEAAGGLATIPPLLGHERQYVPLWGGKSWEENSRRARGILNGVGCPPLDELTDFERWAWDATMEVAAQ